MKQTRKGSNLTRNSQTRLRALVRGRPRRQPSAVRPRCGISHASRLALSAVTRASTTRARMNPSWVPMSRLINVTGLISSKMPGGCTNVKSR